MEKENTPDSTFNTLVTLVEQSLDEGQPIVFRYGMSLRPLSLNSCPMDFVDAEEADGRFGDHSRHGVLVYDRPLTAEESTKFDLPFLIDASMNSALAQYVIENTKNKYLHEYIEDLTIPNRTEALTKIVNEVLGKIPLALENQDALFEAMETHLRLHQPPDEPSYPTPR